MFFVNYSTYEGRPLMIFREPEDIKRDLHNIREKITYTNQRLNIRSALMDLVARAAEGNAEDWVRDLKLIVDDAEESLEELKSLKSQLECFTVELEETLCVMGCRR